MEIKETKYTKQKYNIRVKINERHLWPLFHPHHYMSDSLASGASFYTFYMYNNGKETLFGCMGVIPQISKVEARRITRLVILPEFQGQGLVKCMINQIGEYYHSKGIRLYCATFHPRLGEYQERSELWEASSNNQKEVKTKNTFFEDNDLHTGLRDGVAMYRYYYKGSENSPDYKLLYDPLEISALKTIRKESPSPEINKQIKDKEQEIKDLQEKIYGEDLKIVNDYEHEQSKEKFKKIFNKNKRKPLTKEERQELKRKRNEK